MKRKLVAVVLSIIMLVGLSSVCFANSNGDPIFNDVSRDDWFYNAVKFTYANDIIKGYNENTFAPQDNITRGMLVTILYRMENSPQNDGKSGFSDVENNEWYSKAVKWAVENGIVHGYEGINKFGPNDNILRQDFAVILRNYSKFKGKDVDSKTEITGFTDIEEIGSYAKSAMTWAVDKKVITGNTNGTLNPLGNATRAEAAAMVEKYCMRVAEYSSKVDETKLKKTINNSLIELAKEDKNEAEGFYAKYFELARVDNNDNVDIYVWAQYGKLDSERKQISSTSVPVKLTISLNDYSLVKSDVPADDTDYTTYFSKVSGKLKNLDSKNKDAFYGETYYYLNKQIYKKLNSNGVVNPEYPDYIILEGNSIYLSTDKEEKILEGTFNLDSTNGIEYKVLNPTQDYAFYTSAKYSFATLDGKDIILVVSGNSMQEYEKQ